MIIAIIPLKRLTEAKSRLSPHLSSEERAALMRCLVGRTVGVLRAVEEIDRIVLATAEDAVAAELGVEAVPEAGGLNPTLASAIEWAVAEGATAVLILPADLPLLGSGDVRRLVNCPRHGMTIAPSRDGGTNALLLSPPDILPPSFGEDSFHRHLTLAAQHGIAARVVASDTLSLDLDRVDDLALMK